MLNWKLRFKNKATLVTLVVAMVTLIYTGLGIFGVTPRVAQDEIINLIMLGVNVLVILGIVVDPTTAGISDSHKALDYNKPADRIRMHNEDK